MLYLTLTELLTNLKDNEQFGNDMLSATIEYNNYGFNDNEIVVRTWNKVSGAYLPIGSDCVTEEVFHVLEAIENKLNEHFPNATIRITQNDIGYGFNDEW